MKEFQKIAIAALNATFGENAANIAELCFRAENPQYEVEKLLGIFVMPELPIVTRNKNEGQGDFMLIKICPEKKVTDVVEYSYFCIATRYFANEDSYEKNKNSRYEGRSSASESCPFAGKVSWTENSSCSVETWLSRGVPTENA